MIEGLHIDVSSDELTQHLQERAIHHKLKAEAYEQQAVSVRELGAANPGQSNDPSSSLAQSAASHAARMAFFQFMADHVIPDETYRLSESDLTRVEFVSRYL